MTIEKKKVGLLLIIAAIAIFITYFIIVKYMPQITTVRAVKITAPQQISPGQTITLTGTVQAGLFGGEYLVEMGVIPIGVAQDWGFLSLLSMSPTLGQCCEGQENIKDAWVTLSPGESKTITFTVRAPYSGITDKCYDNNYWDGRGKNYVVYLSIHDKCYTPAGHLTYSFLTQQVYMV